METADRRCQIYIRDPGIILKYQNRLINPVHMSPFRLLYGQKQIKHDNCA